MNIPDFSLGTSLTEEQLAFFDDHGFIRFRSVANHEECDALSNVLAQLSDTWNEEGKKTALGIPIQWGLKPDGRRYVQRLAYSSHYSKVVADFCTSDRFEPVRALCGKDARLA